MGLNHKKGKNMDNQKALEYWKNLSKTPDLTQESVKVNKINNHYKEDANFILRFTDKNTDILDLGAGSGGALNLYYNKINFVLAVEKFKEFSNLIVRADNVEIINADIKDFDTNKKFDLVLLFGVMQFFNEQESKQIYTKCKKFLQKERGKSKLLIKQQFGLKEDVFVEYSNELKQKYFSTYRHIDKEIELLKNAGFKTISKFDIYDKKANRWENTHFYALVCE